MGSEMVRVGEEDETETEPALNRAPNPTLRPSVTTDR